MTFTNNGSSTTKGATQSVTYKPFLTKQATKQEKYNSSWEIKYNFSNIPITTSNNVLTDTMTGPHNIDTTSITVTKADGSAASGYTISDKGPKGFKVTFPIGSSDAYIIKYDAKYDSQTFFEDKKEAGGTTIDNRVNAGSKTNINGKPINGKSVIVKKVTTVVGDPTYKTDEQGQITLKSLEPGEYTVYEADGTTVIGTFVTDECQAVIQPKVADKCPKFEIKVENPNNILKTPVSKLVLKNGNQTFEIAKDKDGKFVGYTETTTMPAGTYNVYDGNLFLGTVEVDYEVVDCEATLTINEAPTCPKFTLTIKDMYGNTRKDVTVTLTDETGKEVEVNGSKEFKTNEQGQIEIKTDVIKAGKYTVKEGTKVLGTITVGNTCEATIQPPRPTPPTPTGPKCDDYTVTVQGLGEGENTPRPGVEVQMKNAAGTIVATGTTNKDGKIVFPRKDFAKGEYTIYIDGAHIKVITITDDDCDVTVTYKQPEISCPNVTVTVKDEEGNARPNVDVTIKDSEGKIVTTGKTNEKGEIKTDEPLTPGKYEVYEGDTKIGEFTKDKTTCEYTVQPGKEISCPNVTVTVKDSEDNSKSGVAVTIQDKDGRIVLVGVTDGAGKVVTTGPLASGKYDVFINDEKAGEFTKDTTSCEYTITSNDTPSTGGGTPPTEPGKPGEEKPTEPGKPGEEKPTEPGKPGEEKPTEPGKPTTPPAVEVPTTGDKVVVPIKDKNGNPVVGQEYVVESADGKIKIPTITDKYGNIVIYKSELPNGTYEIVDANGNVVQVIVVNHSNSNVATPSQPNKPSTGGNNAPQNKLPQTDGESTTAMMFGGLLLLAMGVLLIVRRRKVTQG